MCLDKPRCVWTSSRISPADLNCRVEGLKVCFQTKMNLKAYPYAPCMVYATLDTLYTVTYINHNNFDDLCFLFSGHINLHQMEQMASLMRWYWSFAGKAQASAMSSVSIADLGTFFWIFESPNRNIDTKPVFLRVFTALFGDSIDEYGL